MIDFTTTECLLFPEIFVKPRRIAVRSTKGSSDGGAILLKAAERRYGLIRGLAGCLRDKRQAGKVDHPMHELLAQRVFSIACGYPDGQRLGPTRRRSDSQDAARPRSRYRTRSGLAAHAVAL